MNASMLYAAFAVLAGASMGVSWASGHIGRAALQAVIAAVLWLFAILCRRREFGTKP